MNTYAVVGLAETSGLLERATVERDSHVDLRDRSATGDVVLNGLVRGDAGALAAVQVGLVVRPGQPGTGVVVCLEGERVSVSVEPQRKPRVAED